MEIFSWLPGTYFYQFFLCFQVSLGHAEKSKLLRARDTITDVTGK